MDFWRQTPYTAGIQKISKHSTTTPNQLKIVT